MRFGDFLNTVGYKSPCLAEVNLPLQIQDGVLQNTGNVFVVYDLSFTSRYHVGAYKHNSTGHTLVFEVEHVSDVNTDTV